MKLTYIAVLVLSALLVAQAQAVLYNVNVNLDGLQEPTPVATPGVGTATVTFNDVTGDMSVSGSFSGLLGNATMAHVHGYAGPGGTASPLFTLTISPSTSGTFSGNGLTDIPNTLAGLTYINIHSTAESGGEIRGQIIIPEPATVGLLGTCVVAVLARRRR